MNDLPSGCAKVTLVLQNLSEEDIANLNLSHEDVEKLAEIQNSAKRHA